MRILFIMIQLTLILSACAYQQGRQDQNVEKESTRQQETKPIHVKDTTQETKDNGTRTDIAKHLVSVAEKIPMSKMQQPLCSEVMPLLGLMSMILWTEAKWKRLNILWHRL